jgi:hypothetical protein
MSLVKIPKCTCCRCVRTTRVRVRRATLIHLGEAIRLQFFQTRYGTFGLHFDVQIAKLGERALQLLARTLRTGFRVLSEVLAIYFHRRQKYNKIIRRFRAFGSPRPIGT